MDWFRPQILQELKDGIPLTLSTLSTFIVSSGPDRDSSNQEKALKCLQSWVQYGIDLEYVPFSISIFLLE